MIPGLGISLSCKPKDDHRNIVLHVFAGKLGLEFDNFVIYCFQGTPYGTLIFGFYPDPVGPVGYYDIYWYKLLHVSNSCFNFKITSGKGLFEVKMF